MKFLSLFLLFVLSFSSLPLIICEVVCSEEVLARELLEDINDNGKLDCLREIRDENGKVIQSAAAWDSDCAFESEPKTEHWKTRLIRNYGLTKGLVDVNGNPVPDDFDDQADMCEIIRALIANGVFPNISTDITNINPAIVNLIDCPGEQGQTEVCAATAGSYADKEGWYIFLDGQSITFNGKPKYKLEG